MAEVFRATRLGAEGFQRTVAIKRIRPGLDQEEPFNELFIREAQVMARLRHPNIVSALGFERDRNGELFLVLEFVDGVDLDKLLAGGPLPHAVTIFIVGEILRGLAHAHSLPTDSGDVGIVHRDLSPHNVLLSWDGAVKVADFGVAKFCRAGHASASRELRGKAAFMSPEQVNCRPLDARSDLFSVGIMLWEMLTGERLFRHENSNVTIWRVLTQSIIRPGLLRPVASDLESVAMRLLERTPAHRFPHAEAAFDALAACDDASPLGRFDLERLLAERFPQKAPPRRPHQPMEKPSPVSCRHAEIASPSLPRTQGRWWRVVAVVTVCAVSALVGVLGGIAAARACQPNAPTVPSGDVVPDRERRGQGNTACGSGVSESWHHRPRAHAITSYVSEREDVNEIELAIPDLAIASVPSEPRSRVIQAPETQ